MSAAEEYARQARLAAEESKASAARSAAHAQASAEATASMIIGSASSSATSAEASATAAATAASQAIAARDLAEASGERARQAADGAERSQADVAHSVELIRGMTIGLKLPACTNKGIKIKRVGCPHGKIQFISVRWCQQLSVIETVIVWIKHLLPPHFQIYLGL